MLGGGFEYWESKSGKGVVNMKHGRYWCIKLRNKEDWVYASPDELDGAVEQVAVLDSHDMVCEWVDYATVMGSGLEVHGLTDKWYFSRMDRFLGDGVEVLRLKKNEILVRFMEKGYEFRGDLVRGYDFKASDSFRCNGKDWFVHEVWRGMTFLRLMALYACGNGVYRFDFVCGGGTEYMPLTFWMESGSGRVLGYWTVKGGLTRADKNPLLGVFPVGAQGEWGRLCGLLSGQDMWRLY